MRRRRRSRRHNGEYSDYYDEDAGPEQRRTRQRDPDAGIILPNWVFHLAILVSIAGGLLILVWLTAGVPVLEKTLQALVAPTGLLWIGLFAITYFNLLYRNGFPAFLAFACWIMLTITGNSLFASWMVNSLQGQYEEVDPQSVARFDLLLVLGGGQTTTPGGNAQVNDAGDRCLTAYQLVREDKADLVICAGTSGLPLAKGELNQADALEQILLSLGTPPEKILKLGGRNTIQELQAFDDWLTTNNAGQFRKGIITSAWHMPRVMRLADTLGIQAEPVPADFVNTRIKQTPALLIPSARNLSWVTRCLKEQLAAWMGR